MLKSSSVYNYWERTVLIEACKVDCILELFNSSEIY
jgi:hypothetical protein